MGQRESKWVLQWVTTELRSSRRLRDSLSAPGPQGTLGPVACDIGDQWPSCTGGDRLGLSELRCRAERDGAAAARRPHKPEVGGSNPSPATGSPGTALPVWICSEVMAMPRWSGGSGNLSPGPHISAGPCSSVVERPRFVDPEAERRGEGAGSIPATDAPNRVLRGVPGRLLRPFRPLGGGVEARLSCWSALWQRGAGFRASDRGVSAVARSSRWQTIDTTKALRRPCPRCGVPANMRCRRVRASNTTDGPEDGSYVVVLKTLHRERRQADGGR